MDFIDTMRTLEQRFSERVEHLDTEEATKNALVMPFIRDLGYNVFDPTEVVPEFTADVGMKKGEKVDYALMKDGKPIILIECKRFGTNLDEVEASQLRRYFGTVTDARFGVLTDGLRYRFYSDLDRRNIMDTKPFLEFSFDKFEDEEVEELKRFRRPSFEAQEIVDAARELKYTKEMKRILSDQMDSPSEDFVRFFATQLYSGRMTHGVMQQFAELTKTALHQFVNDRISGRLKSALEREEASVEQQTAGAGEPLTHSGDNPPTQQQEVATTEEEVQGYYVVKAILRETVNAS